MDSKIKKFCDYIREWQDSDAERRSFFAMIAEEDGINFCVNGNRLLTVGAILSVMNQNKHAAEIICYAAKIYENPYLSNMVNKMLAGYCREKGIRANVVIVSGKRDSSEEKGK